ncbi:MAG: hypothetical protein CMG67_03270 [Candidatus Marinimicrobia bacterium]|nr:hypothetical protein [Candidatus Neomarinimicrobiota bacterium]|tara:strand:- start:1479 stop:1736 length:258 start_codon:yes stop_codon:yes gene_type:complete
MIQLIFIFFFSVLQANYCLNSDSFFSRSIYEIGDTLSVEDQNILFPVCNGSGDYSAGDFFTFSDLNGSINGGDYKVTIISMNATW